MAIARQVLLAIVVGVLLHAGLAAASDPRPHEIADHGEAHRVAMRFAVAGQIASALPYFERALELEPKIPSYMNNLAVTYMRLARNAEAQLLLLRALDVNPGFEDAVGNIKDLAGRWSAMPRDPVTARILGVTPERGDFSLEELYASASAPSAPRAEPRGSIPASPAAAPAAAATPTASASATTLDDDDDADVADDARRRSILRARHERLNGQLVSESELAQAQAHLDKLKAQYPDATPSPAASSSSAGKPRASPQPQPGLSEHGVLRLTRENTNARSQLPRIHITQWDKPENEPYRRGLLPFVVTGAVHVPGVIDAPDPSPAEAGTIDADVAPGSDVARLARVWAPRRIAKLFPTSTADFYPHNMDVASVRPYLTHLRNAVDEFYKPSPSFPKNNVIPGTYIQFNVDDDDWRVLKNIVTYPSHFTRDADWLYPCLGSKELVNEFTKRVHWRMVLVGSVGAGMFNHIDALRTSSFQAQLVGGKRWHLCAPDQRPYLYGAGKVDCFHPDYEKYPMFRYARCYDDVVRAGEIVFYPRDYWHQTENVDTPSVALSASIMDSNSYAEIRDELEAECATQKYKWGFTPALCAALRSKCFPMWTELYGPAAKPAGTASQGAPASPVPAPPAATTAAAETSAAPTTIRRKRQKDEL